MEKEIQKWMERQKILEVINHLFLQTDNRNWADVENCFAEKVWFDMTSLAGGEPVSLTPRQITAAWDEGLKDLKAIHHQTGNFLVSLDGNSSDVFCYGIASHYKPNESGRNVRTIVGSYDFHLTQKGGEWKIDTFKFNLKYIDGNPDL
jgi:hypothetical protein